MSLRTRLVAGLLALAAVGLLLLAGITYASQRNFLLHRVDRQVRDTAMAAADRSVLAARGQGAFPLGLRNPAPGGPADGRDGPRPPRGEHGPEGPVGGTWLFARDAAGRRAMRPRCQCYDTDDAKAPKIPASLSAGQYLTVHGNGISYRVYAAARSDGGLGIAAAPLTESEQTLHRLLRESALVILGILLALGALSWWLVRIGLRPLDRMGATAGAIAGGDLSHRVEVDNPRTEVGRLGGALNRMLDRLENAFAERQASEDRLRRFIADASHELRTPLASIRGYAELFRIGAVREADDTEKAMRRIEEEAARMGVLVEDLLTLARLDEVRDPIREPVDLTRLASDTVDDARAVAPDRDITLSASGPVMLQADPHQVRQVLGNLVRNALVHTPASTPIEVIARQEGDDAILEVRDHGPGLPTADGGALFERFWRAEQGRERGKAGAGLGLAIVAGIVNAHGGEVRASNAEPGGARFTVRLPVAAPAPSTASGGPAPAAE